MRLEYVRLVNYAGLKRGSNLDDIEIDFSRQKYRICVIVGKNKSGKSTLENALHPLPDSNDSFLQGKHGCKILRYSTDSGLIELEISHPVNSKGERSTTKGSFKKFIDGRWVEMNPNGNIGSYKDLVETTFGLDPSFLALSRLSSEDRGLVDKSPSERKRFVTNILENLETFNDIGRTMAKRVSTLKAMINSISSKIDSIGNEEQLHLSLETITKKIDLLLDEKDKCIIGKTMDESRVESLDPTKTIIDNYNEIIRSYNDLDTLVEKQQEILFRIGNTTDIRAIEAIINSNLKKLENELSILEKEIYNIDSTLPSLMTEYEEQKRMIELKKSRLDSLQSETDFKDLKAMYKSTEQQLIQCENLFKEMNITNPENISKDEYILALNTLKQIKEYISVLQSSMYRDIILEALNRVLSDNDLYEKKVLFKERQNKLSSRKTELIVEINNLESDINRIKVLDSRPNNCKIDTCSFIAEAVNIARRNPKEKLELSYSELASIDDELVLLSSQISIEDTIIECCNYLRSIIRDIENNKSLLLKLPHGEKFIDINYLVDSVLNGEDFSIMDDIYKTITNANIFDIYRIQKQKFIQINSEMKIYDSKNEIIEELVNELNELNIKLDSVMEKLEDFQNQKFIKSSLITAKRDDLNKYKVLEVTLNELLSNIKERDKLKNVIEKEESNISVIQICIDRVNKYNERINQINQELKPINQEKDKINYSIRMLEQYKEELKTYQYKYNLSEIIKKHSTPTTGIQLIFMKIFMGKTIKMTNELLQNFFGGDLYLSPDYKIDEHEFRLPCYDVPSGIMNNDISNCSTSEKCMLGMLISYVLLRQSSSDYNILRLDEVDGGLDANNRLNFLPTVYNMIDMLEVSQCFIISHSSEAILSNVDIIQLTSAQNNVNNIDGNIIFSV